MFFKRLVVMIMVSFSSAVLAFTPTPEQIAQFKKLPKAQQEALAKQYGVDLSLISGDKNISQNEMSSQASVKERQLGEDNLAETPSLDPTKDPLKPFGYELFAGEPSSFAPTEQAAVPNDYIIGRGDSITVNLYGKESREHTLTVDNEGRLSIPEFSPVQVAGLTYAELKNLVAQKIKQEAIGLNVFVSMAQLRAMRIMIVGEAYKPGSYVVSPLATVTHGLFVSGGLTEIASLRNIEVKRKGKTVAILDLYDLLLSGDSSGDVTLRSGDVIFIPSVGPQVTVEGAVKREGIFELSADDSHSDIIKMFGGFKENAYLDRVLVQRVHNNQKNKALSVDFNNPLVNYTPLAGDHLKVPTINETVVDSVTLIGAVVRPGHYQWQQGLTLDQLIGNIKSDLLPQADLGYGLIVREKSELGEFNTVQFSIPDVMNNKDTVLHKNDEVYIFSRFEFLEEEQKALENLALTEEQKVQQEKVKLWHLYEHKQFESKVLSFEDALQQELSELEQDEEFEEVKEFAVFSRTSLLEPIVNRLKYQASVNSKQATFEVLGQVKYPGEYPLPVNANVKSAVQAAGGFLESAHKSKAELTRYLNDGDRRFEHIDLDMTVPESLNFAIQSRDVVNVFMHPNWQDSYKVHLNGEVKYPGTYTVSRGETLQDLLKRAGGLSPYAEPKAAIFTRESIKEQEQEQLEKLSNELRKDIASRSFQKSIGMNTSISYDEMKKLLNDVANVKAIGRLVIELPRILKEQDNLILQDGDTLHVPGKQDSISIIGEVNYASSHLFKAGVSIDDYLALSGGVKDRAKEEQIYVIKANGAVFIPKSAGWFSVNYQNELEPGDTIVVPMDASHMDNLTLWSTATQIFYQLGVGIAALARI